MSSVAVVANTNKIDRKDALFLRRSLAAAGFDDVRWLDVARGPDSKAAAEKALKHGAETIVACGGDGTVRAVAEALVGTTAGLAVVPTGTANLFASGLELPTDIEDVVDVVARGDRHRIDTAVCNGRTFNVIAGAGLDVGMLAGAEGGKERLGALAYVRAGVHEARHRRMFDVAIAVDGEEFYEGPVSCVLVGNTGAMTGGVESFPGATSTDGCLHVAVVTATGLREWASLMVTAVRHKQQWSSHAQIGEGASITVSFDKKRRFELDGGVKGRSRKLEFAIRPRSLFVCVPST